MSQNALTFLHCADLHLDAVLGDSTRNSQLQDISADERKVLRDAPLLALGRIRDVVRDQQIKLVVIAGDIFNRRDGVSSDIRTRAAFTEFLRDLSAMGTHVVIALGNHDPLSSIRELCVAWPNTVHVLSQRAPETVQLVIDGHEVAIHGMSYETNEEIRDLASMYPARIDGVVNVGVLHTNVGANENHSNYAPSSVNELAGLHYDYFALGHIHKRGVINDVPFVAYSGNPQGLSAKPSECEPKGCVVVSIDGPRGHVHDEFIETDVVRYITHDISIAAGTHTEDIASHIAHVLADKYTQSSLLYLCRLNVTFENDSLTINPETLLSMVNEQRDRVMVTKLTLASHDAGFDDLANSHVFFELIRDELADVHVPSIDTLFGKKADAIAPLLGNAGIDAETFADDVERHIHYTYTSQSK